MGYLIDHWRGRQSLVRSFWLNGLAANLAGVAVAGGAQLVIAGQAADSPAGMLAGLLIMWTLLITLTLWQVVGAWRAASRRSRDGHPPLWPRLAKAALTLAVIASAVGLVQGGRQVAHVGRLALGLDGLHGEVTHDGDAVRLTGHVTFDAPGRVAALLGEPAAPGRLRLNSPGGYIGPADTLRDLVERRGLDTEARGTCLSACTLIFVAGIRRIAIPGTRFGFHGFTLPGASESELAAEEAQVMARWRDKGVAPGFVSQAFAAEGDAMWHPSLRELAASDFVTHVAVAGTLREAKAYCADHDCR